MYGGPKVSLIGDWTELLLSLWDDGLHGPALVPGASVAEWVGLTEHGYDQIDRDHYLDTIGG